MSLNRRDFLISASVLFSSPVLLGGRWAFGQGQSSVLPELAVVDARENLAFRLEALHGGTHFVGGALTPTMGFNQSYLGPVVRVRTGTTVNAEIVNGTERVISVHWHGLLIPGDVDGGPHQTIPAGRTWQPALAIDQPAATLWYHTHVHGETADGVYTGLAGVLLVDDGRDNERGLPNDLGIDDFVLVIQDKRVADNGIATYQATADDALHGFLGDRMIVNGAVEPRAAVPAGIVRLRLLNACNARNLDLAFADGRLFDLIATDQGLLPSSLVIDGLRLSPGERAEILVDFGDGTAARLMSRRHDEGVGAMGMDHAMGGMEMREDPIDGPFVVVEFEVHSQLNAPIRSKPAWLTGDVDELPTEIPATTRTFVLNDMGSMDQPGMSGMPGMNMPGMNMGAAAGVDAAAGVQFGINGRPFAMDRIDHETIVGSTERWIIGGQMMGHPFHIHGARFRVLSEGGGPPRAENSGWKDTVFVTGEVELLAEFPHLAPPNAPFMFTATFWNMKTAG